MKLCFGDMPVFSMTVIPTEKAGYKPDKKACGMLKPSKKRGAKTRHSHTKKFWSKVFT